ncbi:LysR family transcriptional regulator [Lentzea sp. NPDC102401]|uniref:LysR family transcriptional regulator n=1 Tax=Lentzea sp. NPDC102401 TaxID=3364128 RepID=UPI0037FD3DBC
MLLRQLEYLVALARERHFGRAAEACHVSQPSLSAAISKLERELGVPIVSRGRRFESLTPEGERVLLWAHRMLADRDALRQDLSQPHPFSRRRSASATRTSGSRWSRCPRRRSHAGSRSSNSTSR